MTNPGGGFGRPGGRGGSNSSDEFLKELEDRNALIAERRRRAAEGDRLESQEKKLAAERLGACVAACAPDAR